MSADADLVIQSFELAAARCEDLTPVVYPMLFADHPEMERLFFRDAETHAVRGEMMARVIEAIIDFVGERHYARTLIQCEVVTHAGYDVPPEVFSTFFAYVRNGVRKVIGNDWTPGMAAAWERTLTSLVFYAEHDDQYETPGNVDREEALS
ncbi:MAG: globin [Micropepsaceae bacterium]